MKAATMVPEDQHFILSTLSPGPAQKRLALGIVFGPLVALYQGRLGIPTPTNFQVRILGKTLSE